MGLSPADLQLLAQEEAQRRARRRKESAALEEDWRGWLGSIFPGHTSHPFAPHHVEFWEWAWSLVPGKAGRPFVGVWPRGGGKSSSAEMAVVALGARGVRRYALYVSSTQDQADNRVEAISDLLESEEVGLRYPNLGRRALGKFGAQKGWRRNRLWTAAGLTVDGLGLDTAAARGLKLEGQRPDLVVLDDIDARHDSAKLTRRKLEAITDTILPVGSSDMAVLAVQNLIIPDGFFGRLVSGRATCLANRIVAGPVPAIRNLKTQREVNDDGTVRDVIVGGEPVWAGQGLEACQNLIDLAGLPSFLREQQHQVDEPEGALWKRQSIRRVERVPEDLVRVVVGVDPPGGRTECGIIAAGLGSDGIVYVLEDNTQPGPRGPENWGRAVYSTYAGQQAGRIVAERNFGGDMVESTLRAAAPNGENLPVALVNASRGKRIRAEPVAALYSRGKVVHVGVHAELEDELVSWVPGVSDSPNRLDALVWAVTELALGSEASGATVNIPGW